jgi:putative ubiquitin-RnfH superfamily antitoxin RatB of RatAB toxin-antitoxin module
MAHLKQINIEVAYATITQQSVLRLEVPLGTTIESAIDRSGILFIFPEIDLANQKVGIFSEQKKLYDVVNDGDRIEIYRPLTVDPKEARRKRVKRA